MKKIYSLVLLATTLLFSTNVMADIVSLSASNSSELVAAFGNAADSAIITLGDAFALETSIVIQNGKYRKLNVNGKTLSATLSGAYSYQGLFYVVHGTLEIVGSGELINNANASSSVILMSGAGYLCDTEGMPMADGKMNDRNLYGNFSNLIIGDGQNELRLTTNAMKSGAAVGACIEVYGMANQAITNTIKQAAAGISYEGYVSNYYYKNGTKYATANSTHAAYGVNVTVKNNAVVYGSKYGIQISGTVGTPDTLNRPVINILNGAEVSSNATASESTALYAAGMGEWNVAGEIHGSSGAYVKAGAFNVTGGAVIYSDNPNHRDIENTTSGVVAGGSAIVYESNKAYIGDIKIHISGDCLIGTKEEGMANNAGGFAIEGDQASDANNQVQGIVIEGGTFVSGAEGCFDAAPVIEALNNGENVDIHIFGTTFDNKTEAGGVIDLLTAAAGDDYYVAQTTNISGETVYIITETPSDAEVVPQNTSIDQTDGLKWITWTDHTGAVSIDEAKVAFLSLEGSSHLTIPSGKILHVGSVVVTTYSDITVEPGGQLIIDSIGGLVANQTSNLILQSDASGSAVFVLNPNVVANTHPSATVQMYAKAHKTGNIWHTQHVAIPTTAAPAITFPTGGTTYAYIWQNGGWKNVTSLSQFDTPFRGYAFNFSGASAAGIYTYKGNIVGSGNGALNFSEADWNVMGNSYNSPIDARQMLLDLNSELGDDVEGTIWIYLSNEDRHESANAMLIQEGDADFTHIAPMQGFIMRRIAADAVSGAINYTNSVWNNTNRTNVEILAPARRSANRATKATVVITTAKSHDKVVLRESSAYSDAFDNGADASKFMDERVFNFYGSNAETTLSQIATDNLDGKKLSLQATDETVYTMSFANVNNFDYVLRDNANGTIISVEEGQTYTFNVAAGTTAADRFELVDVRKMPTALDNVKAAAKAKGVYTVLGQYLGETDQLNKLPKGIYVVDGQKIVK